MMCPTGTVVVQNMKQKSRLFSKHVTFSNKVSDCEIFNYNEKMTVLF